MVMLQQKQLRGKSGGRHNWEFHVQALSESGLSCQSALKNDPPSASKIDPPQAVFFSA
jgi:hypothetical protein